MFHINLCFSAGHFGRGNTYTYTVFLNNEKNRVRKNLGELILNDLAKLPYLNPLRIN